MSFVALGTFWERPRLAAAATGRPILDAGGPAARVVEFALKLVGLFLFGVVVSAAWWGNRSFAANLAGDAFLIWFWVGLQFVSVVVGDVWRAFNPYPTLADTAAWVLARVRGRSISPVDHGDAAVWPAVVAVFAFLWYELAYHSSVSPRSVGVFITVYSVLLLTGGAVFGRGWVRSADGFGVLFSMLAAMAPLHLDDDRRLRLRPPLAGLATAPRVAGTVPFILVVLGATTFDGFARSDLWAEIESTRIDQAGGSIGWDVTVVRSLGLVAAIVVVGLAYTLAINLMAAITGETAEELSPAFAPTLVPIVAAYAVAHYVGLLVLSGQRVIIHLSDPYGRGWDLFGTKDYDIDWQLVSSDTIAWIQTVAIALGHVLAVAAAHDLAVSRYPRDLAVRSQYPMLGVMVLYTVMGLLLLLGA
jgi:hypothetical protein